MVEVRVFHALVSPQGHVEYNAEFVIGKAGVEGLEPGKWYTNEDLARIAGGVAHFLSDASGSIEKSVKKWRYVRQEFPAGGAR